jgi:hypothetical protein
MSLSKCQGGLLSLLKTHEGLLMRAIWIAACVVLFSYLAPLPADNWPA